MPVLSISWLRTCVSQSWFLSPWAALHEATFLAFEVEGNDFAASKFRRFNTSPADSFTPGGILLPSVSRVHAPRLHFPRFVGFAERVEVILCIDPDEEVVSFSCPSQELHTWAQKPWSPVPEQTDHFNRIVLPFDSILCPYEDKASWHEFHSTDPDAFGCCDPLSSEAVLIPPAAVGSEMPAERFGEVTSNQDVIGSGTELLTPQYSFDPCALVQAWFTPFQCAPFPDDGSADHEASGSGSTNLPSVPSRSVGNSPVPLPGIPQFARDVKAVHSARLRSSEPTDIAGPWVRVWYIHLEIHVRSYLARHLQLRGPPHTWREQIDQLWHDVIVPQVATSIDMVTPSPPRNLTDLGILCDLILAAGLVTARPIEPTAGPRQFSGAVAFGAAVDRNAIIAGLDLTHTCNRRNCEVRHGRAVFSQTAIHQMFPGNGFLINIGHLRSTAAPCLVASSGNDLRLIDGSSVILHTSIKASCSPQFCPVPQTMSVEGPMSCPSQQGDPLSPKAVLISTDWCVPSCDVVEQIQPPTLKGTSQSVAFRPESCPISSCPALTGDSLSSQAVLIPYEQCVFPDVPESQSLVSHESVICNSHDFPTCGPHMKQPHWLSPSSVGGDPLGSSDVIHVHEGCVSASSQSLSSKSAVGTFAVQAKLTDPTENDGQVPDRSPAVLQPVPPPNTPVQPIVCRLLFMTCFWIFLRNFLMPTFFNEGLLCVLGTFIIKPFAGPVYLGVFNFEVPQMFAQILTAWLDVLIQFEAVEIDLVKPRPPRTIHEGRLAFDIIPSQGLAVDRFAGLITVNPSVCTPVIPRYAMAVSFPSETHGQMIIDILAFQQVVGDLAICAPDQPRLLDVTVHQHGPHGTAIAPVFHDSPPMISRVMALQHAHLDEYCQFVQNRCLVKFNGLLWPFQNGTYIHIIVPPPRSKEVPVLRAIEIVEDFGWVTPGNRFADHYPDWGSPDNDADGDIGEAHADSAIVHALRPLTKVVGSASSLDHPVVHTVEHANEDQVHHPPDFTNSVGLMQFVQMPVQAPLPPLHDLQEFLVSFRVSFERIAEEEFDGQGPVVQVITWSNEGRIVTLPIEADSWKPTLAAAWSYWILPGIDVQYYVVHPDPPSAALDVVAHIILAQNQQPDFISVLISSTVPDEDPYYPSHRVVKPPRVVDHWMLVHEGLCWSTAWPSAIAGAKIEFAQLPPALHLRPVHLTQKANDWIGATTPDNIAAELTAVAAAMIGDLCADSTTPVIIRPDLQLSARLAEGIWTCRSHPVLVELCHLLGQWFHRTQGQFLEVRGHAHHPWNELADTLARSVMFGSPSVGMCDWIPFSALVRSGDMSWGWLLGASEPVHRCFPPGSDEGCWQITPSMRRIQVAPLDPVTITPSQVAFLCASANVLAIGAAPDLGDSLPASERALRLDQQWHEQQIAIIGLQEARRTAGRSQTDHYVCFWSPTMQPCLALFWM
eukprot:s2429_g8.t1